uniref:Receptor activity-modifying protein 2 n=1 Tax=Sus scrofa TaxID=9823 RepID=A0A4X1TYD6_PIG
CGGRGFGYEWEGIGAAPFFRAPGGGLPYSSFSSESSPDFQESRPPTHNPPSSRLHRPDPHPTAHCSLSFLPTAVLKPQESLAQHFPTPDYLNLEGKTLEENYETDAQLCWHDYKDYMDSIKKDWCDWALISRPYSILQECLEQKADAFKLGFPNPWAERIIFEAHRIHFANCSLVQPTFSDPPEDVLLAMIMVPICLIPFLVTLVVWRSKDPEAQT